MLYFLTAVDTINSLKLKKKQNSAAVEQDVLLYKRTFPGGPEGVAGGDLWGRTAGEHVTELRHHETSRPVPGKEEGTPD